MKKLALILISLTLLVVSGCTLADKHKEAIFYKDIYGDNITGGNFTGDRIIANWIKTQELYLTSAGKFGIRILTLTGDITLTAGTDYIDQYLNTGASNRNVTLATAGVATGSIFTIKNTTNTLSYYIGIFQAGVTIDYVMPSQCLSYIFNGTNWVGHGNGISTTLESLANYSSVAIGNRVYAFNSSVGIGKSAYVEGHSVAIGYAPLAYNSSLAIGQSSQATSYSLALGYSAYANNTYSQAFGYYSQNYRNGETSINIDGNTSQTNNAIQGRWSGSTSNNTTTEIYCAGISGSRFTVRPKSALAFTMTVVARDNVGNKVAMYTVSNGLIKRDGANNTVLSSGTVITAYEDDATWDFAISADDVNEYLKITVTGDAADVVQWAVVLDGVETHF